MTWFIYGIPCKPSNFQLVTKRENWKIKNTLRLKMFSCISVASRYIIIYAVTFLRSRSWSGTMLQANARKGNEEGMVTASGVHGRSERDDARNLPRAY